MRFLLIISFLFFLVKSAAIGQSFNLDQLISLTKRDSAAVSEFVKDKNWVLNEFKLPVQDKAGRMTWKQAPLSQSDEFAQSWLVYYYKDKRCRRVSYAVLEKRPYDIIKSQVATKKMAKVGAGKTEKGVQTKYKWGNYTVTLEEKNNDVDQNNKAIKSYEVTIDTI